jgi:hypothetical protein
VTASPDDNPDSPSRIKVSEMEKTRVLGAGKPSRWSDPCLIGGEARVTAYVVASLVGKLAETLPQNNNGTRERVRFYLVLNM